MQTTPVNQPLSEGVLGYREVLQRAPNALLPSIEEKGRLLEGSSLHDYKFRFYKGVY